MNLRERNINLLLLIIFKIPKSTQHAAPRNVLFQLQSRTCFNKQYRVACCKSVIASLVSANNITLQDPLAYVFTMDGRLLHNSCADILHSSYPHLSLTLWHSIPQTFTLTQPREAVDSYCYCHNHLYPCIIIIILNTVIIIQSFKDGWGNLCTPGPPFFVIHLPSVLSFREVFVLPPCPSQDRRVPPMS
jgi:hypothetical protein